MRGRMVAQVRLMLQLGKMRIGTYASALISFGLCLSTT